MNKNRPFFKVSLDEKVCRSIRDGKERSCPKEGFCKFSHDLKAFMDRKPPDIGEKCPIYSLKGYCMFGITCRFSKDHLNDDNTNKIPEGTETPSDPPQHLPWEIQNSLRKKKFDYSKSVQILKDTEKLMQNEKNKPVGDVPVTKLSRKDRKRRKESTSAINLCSAH